MDAAICTYLRLTFVYTLKFPKIVSLSCKVKITAVFKIMDRENIFDLNICLKRYMFVRHIVTPCEFADRSHCCGTGKAMLILLQAGSEVRMIYDKKD